MSTITCEHCKENHTRINVLRLKGNKEKKFYFCPPCGDEKLRSYDVLEVEKKVYFSKKLQCWVRVVEEEEKELNDMLADTLDSCYQEEQETSYTNKDGEIKRTRIIIKETARKEKTSVLALRELDHFVGMQSVKEQLQNLFIQREAREYLRKYSALQFKKPSMHTFIEGSSGTGKTTLAEALTDIFYTAGLIRERKIVHVKIDDIVGKHVGATGPQTRQKIEEATDGIFFLDEAYQLANGSFRGNNADFGQEALQTIMSAMNENSKVVFVFAGYSDKMKQLFEMNPGFASRISNRLHLLDYTLDELREIGLRDFKKKGYDTHAVESIWTQKLKEEMKQGVLEGNARTVLKHVEAVIAAHLKRIIQMENKEGVSLELLLPEDVLQAFEKNEVDQERLRATYQQAKEKIHALIGLHDVKDKLVQIGDYQYIQTKRKQCGLPVQKKSHHMFFLGEPGTGKTTMARLVGELLRGSGVITNGHLIEATKEKLTKGESIPETVKRVVEEAKGGVLFIDEAYTLANDGKGKEALDSLIAHMENERDDLVVILAGYEKDMQELLKRNEGLASRVPYHFTFESYTKEELIAIAFDLFETAQFVLTEEAMFALHNLITKAKEDNKVDGNARWVRNLFEDIQLIQAKRLVQKETTGHLNDLSDYQLITKEDVEEAGKNLHTLTSQMAGNTEEEEKKEWIEKQLRKMFPTHI